MYAHLGLRIFFGSDILGLRPFLTQSDFDWILLVPLGIVSRVDFIIFVLSLEAVGMREYCCTAVWQSKIGW